MVAGFSNLAGHAFGDVWFTVLFQILGPVLAIAAAWCFRQRAPMVPVQHAAKPKPSSEPVGGLENSIEGMGKISGVLAELLPTLPPQWSAASMDFSEVGPHREGFISVESEGSLYSAEIPDYLADNLFRGKTYYARNRGQHLVRT